MRIAVFIKRTTFHVGFGGLETQNKNLCEGLVKKGHQVVVFSPKWELPFESKQDNGVDYVFIDSKYRYLMSGVSKKSWFNRSYEVFVKFNSENKFDLVLSQSSAGVGIVARKNELAVKVISIVHGSIIGEFKTFIMNHHSLKDAISILKNGFYVLRQFFGRQREFILGSTKIIAVSNAVKIQLMNETFVPEENIDVIHNGVVPFDISTSPINQEIPLVYLGQITKDKGVSLFVDMEKDGKFKGLTINVIGDGSEFSHLTDEASKTHIGANLKMYGKLDYAQTINLLKQFTGGIFLFPTNRVEGFPMVLVEAMLAGLVVVAFDIGGTSDAIENDKTGYLIKSGNVAGFKRQVLELLSNHDKLKEMSKNSRQKALKEFTLDIMLNEYEDLFKKVIKQ